MSLPHSTSSDPQSRLIVALDVPTAAEALALVDRLDGAVRWVKVGMELYYAAGPAIVAELRRRSLEVFLDLKLHDIPNTVASAIKTAGISGAGLLNVHALGGPAMLAAAKEAAAGIPEMRLLAVTVLTSMDAGELDAIGLNARPADEVLRLGRLAMKAGLDGLVCSAEEVVALRHEFGANPLLVVPGIRPAGSAVNDQKRIATPATAITAGASMLVVGRPITRAEDPAAAARAVLTEIQSS